jgi:hypothetical protein
MVIGQRETDRRHVEETWRLLQEAAAQSEQT